MNKGIFYFAMMVLIEILMVTPFVCTILYFFPSAEILKIPLYILSLIILWQIEFRIERDE
jgi:hypothetical protein